jgi:hypothetical protein
MLDTAAKTPAKPTSPEASPADETPKIASGEINAQ